MIHQRPKDKYGKEIPADDSILEYVEFPLRQPTKTDKQIDIPRLVSKLVWGDEEHVDRGSIQNNQNSYDFRF